MMPKSGYRFSDKIMRQQTSTMRVVIAGFGPFPGAPSNPSGHLAMALARRHRPALAGIDITSHVFATAYDAVDRELPKLLARKPDVLLIFGLAGQRREVCIETRARNARSILFPDMRGYRPAHRTIEAGEIGALKGKPRSCAFSPRCDRSACRRDYRATRAPIFAITRIGVRCEASATAGRWCSSCTYLGSVRRRDLDFSCDADRCYRGSLRRPKIC
jgi:pyroglutamyl peptidase